jgi:tetratricopeptide (TPR) repeat protein
VYHEYDDKVYESQVLNDIGNTYYYLEEYDSAVLYLNDALELARETGSRDIEGTALTNLGKVYCRTGQYQKAISFTNSGLEIHKITGSQNKIVESLIDLGDIYNEIENYRLAINYFNRAIDLASEIGARESIRQGYFKRPVTYENLGAYRKSLDDFKAYKNAEDSIFDEKKSQQIEELRTIYETEKKEQELALKDNEIMLLEEQSKVNALRQVILVSGIVLLLVLASLLYFGMHQKLKRKQLEKDFVDNELAFKKQELTTHALHLANKNEILEDLKSQILELRKNGDQPQAYNSIVNTIKLNLQDDKNWENFKNYFDQVHKDFNAKVKQRYPEVTAYELRLMALLKMNLSSKEIANILNISNEGIKKARYRLRKKLNISSEESLSDLIVAL